LIKPVERASFRLWLPAASLVEVEPQGGTRAWPSVAGDGRSWLS
jgi:hypothetical protein